MCRRSTLHRQPEQPGRGNKCGQATGVRVSKRNHSLSAGIDGVDFAACPGILPRPTAGTWRPRHPSNRVLRQLPGREEGCAIRPYSAVTQRCRIELSEFARVGGAMRFLSPANRAGLLSTACFHRCLAVGTEYCRSDSYQSGTFFNSNFKIAAHAHRKMLKVRPTYFPESQFIKYLS